MIIPSSPIQVIEMAKKKKKKSRKKSKKPSKKASAKKSKKPSKRAVPKVQKEKIKEAQKTLKKEKREIEGKQPKKEDILSSEKKRIKILKGFTKDLLKKYGSLIRSIVLFGSTARKEFKGESDIDVFVIVDDTRKRISPNMKDKMEDDMVKIAKKHHKLISVQRPYLLTRFWRLVREGHPIVFNFIREGVPVYDKDIFMPIKRLLQMGEIKPSKESVEKFIERGPKRVKRVEKSKMYMVVEDCYYAMMETAQAVLMFLGRYPPRPKDAPDVLRKTLVEMKFLEEKYVKYLEKIIELRKKVEHKKIKSITGEDLDSWIEKTKLFVKKMQNLIVKIEILKRENMIEKSHSIMSETITTLLRALNKEPKKEESLSAAFKKNLVKKGLVSENYLEIFDDLEDMKKKVSAGKVMDISKRDVLEHREHVRKFIRTASKILKKQKKSE